MAADLDQALSYKLLHFPALQALVGTRIYPIALPQTVTLPAVLFQPISGAPVRIHRERSLLPRATYQITVWAEDLDDGRAIEKVITSELDGFRGTWGTGATATEVQECTASTVPIYHRDPETLLFSVVRDFIIQWKE